METEYQKMMRLTKDSRDKKRKELRPEIIKLIKVWLKNPTKPDHETIDLLNDKLVLCDYWERMDVPEYFRYGKLEFIAMECEEKSAKIGITITTKQKRKTV